MKRTAFTITFEDGESHTRYLTPIGIKDGFWLDSKGKQLQQVNGFTTDALFGEEIKIQINMFNVKDGKKIDVKIKAQIGGKNVPNFQEIIYTLKVKNNIAILDDFYVDPEWYDETIEEYYFNTTTVNGFNVKAHQTTVHPDEAITFNFDVKFKHKEWTTSKSLPKLNTDFLKPVTYRRNYEEFLGLYDHRTKAKDKHKDENYENKFIKSDVKINKVVEKFIKEVSTQGIDAGDIIDLIDEYAPKLWKIATKTVQKNNHDDRPLYWARNKMLTYLKRTPCYKGHFNLETSEIYKGTELETAISNFENKSRNYTGIDFSKAGNKKKVLITGFDPFVMNPHHKGSPGKFERQNPSGITILSLHGKVIGNSYIQCAMIPVRYEDFDNDIIEKIVTDNIKDFDIMLTTSKNNANFDLERFAGKFRNGYLDNMNIGDTKNKPQYNISRFKQLPKHWDGFYETTLPVNKIMQGILSPSTNELYYDQSYEDDMGNSQSHPTALNNNTNNNLPINIKAKSANTGGSGSGSHYLSNEIMYRATKTRDDLQYGKGGLNKLKEVGHIHISKTQAPIEYLKIIKQIIINATK